MKRFVKVFAAFVLALAMVVVFTPVQGIAAAKTVTVSTQAQLDRALKNSSVTNIAISSKASRSLKIAKGNYGTKTLSVNGAKLKVTNNAAFKSVSVIKAEYYTEGSAKGNTLNITAPKLVIYIASTSVGAKVNVNASASKISLKTNGKTTAVNVSKAATVSISGKPKSTVVIKSTAANATISTAVKSSISAAKSASITAAAGANITKMVTAGNSTIIVKKGASVTRMETTGTGSSVIKVAADAAVANIVANARTKVYVTSNAEVGNIVTNGTATINVAANANVGSIESNTSADDNTKTTVNLGKNATVEGLTINGTTKVTVKENSTVDVTVATTEPVAITSVTASAAEESTNANVTVAITQKDANVALGTAAEVTVKENAQITAADEAGGSMIETAKGFRTKIENQTEKSVTAKTVSVTSNEKAETVRTDITAEFPKGTATMDASADKVMIANDTDSDIVVKITITTTDSSGKSTTTTSTEVVKPGKTVYIDPEETKEEEKRMIMQAEVVEFSFHPIRVAAVIRSLHQSRKKQRLNLSLRLLMG